MTEHLNIENMNGGAVVEQINIAINKVVANCRDINMSDDARDITIKLTFTPTNKKAMIAFKAKVTPKLAGQEHLEGSAHLTLDSKGRVVADEVRPIGEQRQLDLGSNVESINQ